MKSSTVGSSLVSSLIRLVGLFVVMTFSANVFADYYVVYSAPLPPPIVVYQKECSTVKHKKIPKKHYRTAKNTHKKNTVVMSVYYVCNQNCGPCGNYNSCNQVVETPVRQGCGYTAYYGQPAIRHSDYYYMQNIDEDYYGPDMDGNTYDNDIY